MARKNNRKKVEFTRADEMWEYTKLFFLFLLAGGYFYLIFK